MFLKTCFLKFEESGIKTIHHSPILNTMQVSGKGHLHNKRYGPYNFLVESKKSDIINFWDTILKFKVAAPCTFRAMFLKTNILKILGSGIKTIQQNPILNTMHVSGKGHLHNKRYGPYNFLVESKKSDIINFWDTILKFQVAAPCTFRPCFSKRVSLSFREVA